MEYVGLFGSVALLIWLALRGINIVFAALLCSLLVIVTNGLPLAAGLTEHFSFGPLGAFTFAGKFFLLFAAGAMFGRVMGDSHAAAAIALALVHWDILTPRITPLLGILGKLAMADIFLIALYITLAKGVGVGRLEPAWGLYLFTACILASLWVSWHTQRGAKAGPAE